MNEDFKTDYNNLKYSNNKDFGNDIIFPNINTKNNLDSHHFNLNENQKNTKTNLLSKKNNNESIKSKIEMSFIKDSEKKLVKVSKKQLLKTKIEKLSKEFSKNNNLSNEIKIHMSNDESKLKYISSSFEKKEKLSIFPKTYQEFVLSPFDIIYYHLDLDDNLLRMMAISICINYCKIYENNVQYQNYFNSILPWKEHFLYKEKTTWMEFNEKNIPDWLSVKQDVRFKKFNFKIKAFSPFVFYHIRLIDKISNDNVIQSLDPVKNLTFLNKLNVSGGRGDNSILSTWNKKFIIKTINKEEKKVLKNMLKLYHKRLIVTKSILCRIYGIFKIEVKDKGAIHVILQRNMDVLPQETKLLTFDLKGSTVDRQCINKKDEKLTSELLINKYSNKVLKDIDLKILKLTFNLNSYDSKNLINSIKKDTEFLEKFGVTDYSLIVFVHKYRFGDMNHSLGNSGLTKSQDRKYIFEFSIIDFLGTFNIEKRGEKLAKTFVGYIKQMKDTNFSVLDPEKYGYRFRKFIENVIPINIEEDSE